MYAIYEHLFAQINCADCYSFIINNIISKYLNVQLLTQINSIQIVMIR